MHLKALVLNYVQLCCQSLALWKRGLQASEEVGDYKICSFMQISIYQILNYIQLIILNQLSTLVQVNFIDKETYVLEYLNLKVQFCKICTNFILQNSFCVFIHICLFIIELRGYCQTSLIETSSIRKPLDFKFYWFEGKPPYLKFKKRS